MRRAIATACLVFGCLGCPPAQPAAGPTPVAGDTSRALQDLFAAEWEYDMRESPTRASSLGDRRFNHLWDDVSLAAVERRHQHDRDVLRRLRAIPRAALGPRDQLDYDLFERTYADAIEGYPFGEHLLPVNQRNGVQNADELADALPFDGVKDYEDWLSRMQRLPLYVDQTIELMREGARRRIVHPRVVMQRVPAQIDKQLVTEPEKSPFYAPFAKMKAIPERDRLQAAARATVKDHVVPAYRRFKDFFERDYLPQCEGGIGAWRRPQGELAYAYLARHHTTTRLTPQQIHDMGVAEVARIRAEMTAIVQKIDFKGTLKDLFGFLRTDARFFYKTGPELLDAYRAISRRIDPQLVKMFGKLPRTPYGVEPIPDAVAPDTTTAYYREAAADGSRAGTYFVNLYKPEVRPRWEMMALSLHEAVPGHHLQFALAMEQTDLPQFRRHADVTAFIEGWALYAESLGDEMGLYDDPYSKLGQLTYEMWRAVRLVVDTGMHALKWDREKAIAFFADNAAKTEHDIVNEVDRYIVWPGQALAYKVGELKIKELRRRASAALGKRFEVRKFHDMLLDQGAIPLEVLEKRVDEWLSEEGRAGSTDR
jgi:uncharacterized protein (DUF885 family)